MRPISWPHPSPASHIIEQWYRTFVFPNPEEVLMLFLRRMTCKQTLLQLESFFNYSTGVGSSRISAACIAFRDWICERAGFTLKRVNPQQVKKYEEAVWKKFKEKWHENYEQAPLPPRKYVCTFLDGHRVNICRPGKINNLPNVDVQNLFYTFYTKTHNLLWLLLVAPDGLSQWLSPVEVGRHADGFIWSQHAEAQDLQEQFSQQQRILNFLYSIYADSAFEGSIICHRPHARNRATEHETRENFIWCKLRVSVEWVFGEIEQMFPYITCTNVLKVANNKRDYGIARLFEALVLMRNIHVCVRGSNASRYFGIRPPTLVEYLRRDNYREARL